MSGARASRTEEKRSRALVVYVSHVVIALVASFYAWWVFRNSYPKSRGTQARSMILLIFKFARKATA